MIHYQLMKGYLFDMESKCLGRELYSGRRDSKVFNLSKLYRPGILYGRIISLPASCLSSKECPLNSKAKANRQDTMSDYSFSMLWYYAIIKCICQPTIQRVQESKIANYWHS